MIHDKQFNIITIPRKFLLFSSSQGITFAPAFNEIQCFAMLRAKVIFLMFQRRIYLTCIMVYVV